MHKLLLKARYIVWLIGIGYCKHFYFVFCYVCVDHGDGNYSTICDSNTKIFFKSMKIAQALS